MTGKDRIILQRIAGYARETSEYIQGITFTAFMQDRKTIAASAFCISQIGELANEISVNTQSAYPQIPWRSIKGMRNKIVHDYENVELAVLWGTITKSLPTLVESIDALLASEAD
ncbi:MAG: DUF86 domain-containing protein [Firmicutes bacterium]|jgi:uncharacterized protein with HEPN domain|nr:DUF86 domain-containing protein [Bacillota bacterium]MCL5993263.1 DUF86 domain-containing protein [Bacillota bacterium]